MAWSKTAVTLPHSKCTRNTTLSRDHFVHVPSQWETTLHWNVFTHWLGACTDGSLHSLSHGYKDTKKKSSDKNNGQPTVSIQKCYFTHRGIPRYENKTVSELPTLPQNYGYRWYDLCVQFELCVYNFSNIVKTSQCVYNISHVKKTS